MHAGANEVLLMNVAWRNGVPALLIAGAIVIAAAGGADAEGTFIPAPSRVDMVHDPTRNILYITSGPDVLRYSLDAQQSLAPFRLGGSLMGVDLTSDGNTLAVADRSFTGVPTGHGLNWIHLIDLRNEAHRQIFFDRAFAEIGTFTVACGSDGSCLVTSEYSGSGWVPLRKVDPGSGATTVLTLGPDFIDRIGVDQNTMLSSSADRSVIGFAEANASDGPWGVYRVTDGQASHRTGYQNGTSAFNYEIGVNRNGSQFAIPTYLGAFIYDSSFAKIATVGQYSNGPVGVVYHPLSDIVYFAWVGTRQLRAFDTRTFRQVAAYDVEYTFQPNGNFAFMDGRMKISRDGLSLFVTVGGGVRYISLVRRYQETDPAIAYSGSWSTYGCAACTGGSLRYSDQHLARAMLSFTGTGIRWVVAKGPMLGKANAYLDGVYAGTVDLYSPTLVYQVVLQQTGLIPGVHSVSVEVSGEKNPDATAYIIDVDAFDVLP
jgi:hypothetical protein